MKSNSFDVSIVIKIFFFYLAELLLTYSLLPQTIGFLIN